jgi:hypothetical protein
MGLFDSIGKIFETGQNILSGGKTGTLQDIAKNYRNAYSSASQDVIKYQDPYVQGGLAGLKGYQGLGEFEFGPENFTPGAPEQYQALQQQIQQLISGAGDLYTTDARGRKKLDQNKLNQLRTQIAPLMQQLQKKSFYDPSYQFRLNEGLGAVERSQASKGQYFSGNTLASLQSRGQQEASQEYQNAYERALSSYNTNKGYYGTSMALGSLQAQGLGENLADLALGRAETGAGVSMAKSQVNQDILSSLTGGIYNAGREEGSTPGFDLAALGKKIGGLF